MAMAMEESEEDINKTRFARMMKSWNGGKGTPILYDDPPADPPKWRGPALRFFTINGPNPAYSIVRRARDIAFTFETRISWRCGYYSSDDEDVDVDEGDEEDVRLRVRWLEELLDELEAYDGESIDVATVLHSDDRYLFTFLQNVLSNKHACIRAKAAQLITSMVQNHHPTAQQLVIQGNGIQLLLHNFTTDPDATSRTKALAAISSLIRNNKSGVAVFLREDGYEALRNALKSGTILAGSSTHNEVVSLIGYLRRENNLVMIQKYKKQEKVETVASSEKNDDKPKHDN